MKKAVLSVWFCVPFLMGFAQIPPSWLSENHRELRYPGEVFITGLSEYIVENGKTPQDCTERAKSDAQADVVKKIRIRIQATTQSSIATLNVNGRYSETESFASQSATQAGAEITGIKTETYFDPKANVVYAFAYVNRYELMGYYKSNLSLNINQIEGFLKTAQDLEAQREKAKARRECEAARPLFDKIREAQDMLTALDGTVSADDLQQNKVTELYNTAAQILARLAQGVYVYVESREDLFGVPVDITANKLKAELAVNGCSFTDNAEEADFRLKLQTSVRQSDSSNDFVFCYADASVELYDNHKQKAVYSDTVSDKSGSNTQDKAARKAMEYVASKIAEKITYWVK